MKSNINNIDSNNYGTVLLRIWSILSFAIVFFLQSVVLADNTTNIITGTNEYPVIPNNSYSVFDYFSDRGNDFLDIISFDYGYGVGVNARIASWGTGVSLGKMKGGIYNGNYNTVMDSQIYSFVVFGYSASRLLDKNLHLANRNKPSGYENIMYPPLIADPFIIIMAAAINLGGQGSNFDDPVHLLLGWPMLYVEGIKCQPDIEISAGLIPFSRFSFNFKELGDFILGWCTVDFCKDDYHKTRTVVEKYPDGQIKSLATYRCKHPIGQWTSWYKNGQIKEKGYYTDCGKTGVWNRWNINGIKSEQENYYCGRKYGSSTWWFANGIIGETGFYSNNLKQGVWTTCHKNGSKASKGKYINGNRNGVWSEWYTNGVMASKHIYKLGNLVGTNTCWYETGMESSRDYYYKTNNINYNYKISWYKNGNKKKEYLYVNGMPKYETSWHKNGNKKEERLYYVNGTLTIMKKWTANGKLIMNKKWSEDGKIIKNEILNR